mmetsp:Transcript_1902/g.5292  ORF Transcript_1902/g.5292 Transcript_1902/m.5292 type:complete len:245 (-) Transcript_1902:222-956(-)
MIASGRRPSVLESHARRLGRRSATGRVPVDPALGLGRPLAPLGVADAPRQLHYLSVLVFGAVADRRQPQLRRDDVRGQLRAERLDLDAPADVVRDASGTLGHLRHRVPVLVRDMHGREAVAGRRLRIGAVPHEGLDAQLGAALRGEPQRRLALAVARVHVGAAVGRQEVDHLDAAVPGGPMQRGPAPLVLGADLGLHLEQQLDAVPEPGCRHDVQQRGPHGLGAGRVAELLLELGVGDLRTGLL